jgi:hypothetical protein
MKATDPTYASRPDSVAIDATADGTIDAWHTRPELTNWRSNAEPR